REPAETRPARFSVRVVSRACRLENGSWKSAPDGLRTQFDIHVGPGLREETEYQIYLRTRGISNSVQLLHRDPQIRRNLVSQERNQVVHGVLNFRGQIGRTEFTVLVDGLPHVTLELEVFPTKLDYQTDFREILCDLQLHARSLALEYLRATYLHGRQIAATKPAELEWLLILRESIDSLEKAIAHIAQMPRRRLEPTEQLMRAERVRRPDSVVRQQLRRGTGSGQAVAVGGMVVREKIRATPHVATLDTPEHRWLRSQLEQIQRQLSGLMNAAATVSESERRSAILNELDGFRQRIASMLRIEPMAAARSTEAAELQSLQLQQAPGYREATQACRVLRLGLALEGDAVRLSVKDLSTLYENWVYIEVLRIIQVLAGNPSGGLNVLPIGRIGVSQVIAKGRENVARFDLGQDRRIEVIYNPQFHNPAAMLIPQRPDILIRLIQPRWPAVQVILDAKYRVENSVEYRRQFGSAGPPADAINVLHRYRDAVLEILPDEDGVKTAKRSVVHAAAIFPGSPDVCREFRQSRLWAALDRLGIGAIPALPHDRSLLEEWLGRILRESGWEIADRLVPHTTESSHRDWQKAAQEPVLISVIDSKDCSERFAWLQSNRCCYVRMPARPHRHFRVSRVAFYCPRPLEKTPAISYAADVLEANVVTRSEILTPWSSRHTPDQTMILYRLGPILRLSRPIIHTDSAETSFRGDRWTTRLALDRATSSTEIALETASEWRLYEGLRSRGIGFRLRLHAISHNDESSERGRVWFLLNDQLRVRFDGANGFLVTAGHTERWYDLPEVLRSAEVATKWPRGEDTA
ncbi:MAG: DUF2357 domain-containing protein, partial [Planctomycetota bacterium]